MNTAHAIGRVIGSSPEPVSVASRPGNLRQLCPDAVVAAESSVDDAHLYAISGDSNAVPCRRSMPRSAFAGDDTSRTRLDLESDSARGCGVEGRRLDRVRAGTKMVLTGTAPADYVAIPIRSVYEVRIEEFAHVRRAHGNSHGSTFRQRKPVVARILTRSICGTALWRPRPIEVQLPFAGNFP